MFQRFDSSSLIMSRASHSLSDQSPINSQPTTNNSLMQTEFIEQISEELSLKAHQVAATAALIAEGGTVPFIARYRKEQTGELDPLGLDGPGA